MDFITENILLIVCFVLSAVMLAFPSLTKGKNAGKNPAEATILVNHQNAQVIDVRNADEFKHGSLANAVNIPCDNLINRIDSLDKSRPILLIDQTGRRAQTALKQLKSKGFVNVYTLEGGLVAWQEAKLPLVVLESNRKKRKH
ncbi:MAG: rhodanese-like domain-containing protein [Burkholderiaceae bacterium]|nr:rhodanese-like domain-containing protein [Burkholderiaceae bacterium]